ncbi:hypothetical protein RFI_34308, partial [Reticulomyxa filosa]
KNEQKYDNNSTSIVISKSLFDITNQDIICIDKEKIDDIIRSWYCPTLKYKQNYRDEWIDFKSIENEIYDCAIFGRHEINISVAVFEYANELTIQNILDNLDRCYPSFKKCTFNSNELEFVQSFFDDPHQAQHVLEITYQIIVMMDRNISDLNMDEHLSKWMKRMQFDIEDWELFEKKNDVILLMNHVGELWHTLNSLQS